MTNDAAAGPIGWLEETRDMGAAGRRSVRTANEPERAAIAAALGLLRCDKLVFEYAIKPSGQGRFRLDGKLEAEVAQPCVVTLEPVFARISEAVLLEFWPNEAIPAPSASPEHEILGVVDPEPLTSLGRVEVGRVAFEVLSASLDPYPRREGAELEWRDPTDDAEAAHPFAALAKLREGKPGK